MCKLLKKSCMLSIMNRQISDICGVPAKSHGNPELQQTYPFAASLSSNMIDLAEVSQVAVDQLPNLLKKSNQGLGSLLQVLS